MKKRHLILVLTFLTIFLTVITLSACSKNKDNENSDSDNNIDNSIGDNNNQDNNNNNNNNQNGENTVNKPEKIYLKIIGNGSESQKEYNVNSDNNTCEIKIVLNSGDKISVKDNKGNTYTSSDSKFDGSIKVSGEYTFKLTIANGNYTFNIVYPESDSTQKETKTTICYTDSERWGTVYAYLWNNGSNKSKSEWPGEKLNVSGTSDYGESQYSIEVDYSVYDRIIFNDGNGKQTKDLVVSNAVSGYYGKDGTFTNGSGDYGRVEYFTLTDTKNLSYISNGTKKISVYTPANYSTDKKFGVLYMFDSQNLYNSADGIEKSHDQYGSWAVDVAVNNLVKNGNDGVIIVAIDNTDGYRDSELTMSQSFGTLTEIADNDDFYNGKLDELGNFMKETLMPWVKSHYSVDSDISKTGIAGSSSGGLAAYYLGLRDNDIYGYIGAFSPGNGLFTSTDWIRFYESKNFGNNKPKIYAYCGMDDNFLEDQLIDATKEIKKLTSYGFSENDIVENYVHNAEHTENFWRIAFMEFLGLMIK